MFIITINNKSERNYRGKCLGWPVTSYGGDDGCLGVRYVPTFVSFSTTLLWMIYTPLSGTVERLYRWIRNLEVRDNTVLLRRGKKVKF